MCLLEKVCTFRKSKFTELSAHSDGTCRGERIAAIIRRGKGEGGVGDEVIIGR